MGQYRGCLYYSGIGDAYALPFEYRKGAYPDWAHLNDGVHYEVHPTFFKTTKPGNFSDDTHRATSLARVMLAGDYLDMAAFDRELVEAFLHNPNAGYSRGMKAGFEKALKEHRSVADVCAEFGRTEKSGAAMGAPVLGLLPNERLVAKVARAQGGLTHTGQALLAAEIAALALHALYYRTCGRDGLLAWLRDHVSEPFETAPWQGKVGSPGMESTRAALTALVQATSLTDLLQRCVAFTGDVDTVAAIAMACAAYSDLEDDLHPDLHKGLENGRWGCDWLIALDVKLQLKFPRPLA